MASTRKVQQQGYVRVVMALFTSVLIKMMTMSSCTSGLHFLCGLLMMVEFLWSREKGFNMSLKSYFMKTEDLRFIHDLLAFWDEIFV